MESAVFLAFLGAISARQEVRYERCSWYKLMRSGQYEVLVQWVLREVEVSEAELFCRNAVVLSANNVRALRRSALG
jgi:hypothetical protein